MINGSVFYLDDFPSPVPGGDGTYVRRDYNTNIDRFLFQYLVAGYDVTCSRAWRQIYGCDDRKL